MRSFLFRLVGTIGDGVVDVLKVVGDFVLDIQARIYNFVIILTAHGFKFLLWVIDPSRIQHAEEVVRQLPMSTELEILILVTKVKEDALERKLWTEDHSMTLNHLGSRLLNECDWDEDRIHDYLRMVVESIPGLTYASSDEEDDDGIPL